MKKTLPYILILILLTACSKDEYTIENEFQANKTYHFTVKQVTHDAGTQKSKELVHVSQIEATFNQVDRGLKCTWKYVDSKTVWADKKLSHISSENDESFNLYEGMEVEFLLDSNGTDIELLNYKEMKKDIIMMLSKLYLNSEIDYNIIDHLMRQKEYTYATPESLLANYFPEIKLYFNFSFRHLIDGVNVKTEKFYPNRYGGEPIPVVVITGINSKDGDVLMIKSTETANQKELKRILKNTIENTPKLRETPNIDEILNLKYSSESKYFYDLKNKLMKKVHNELKVELSGGVQKKIIEVELLVD